MRLSCRYLCTAVARFLGSGRSGILITEVLTVSCVTRTANTNIRGPNNTDNALPRNLLSQQEVACGESGVITIAFPEQSMQ